MQNIFENNHSPLEEINFPRKEFLSGESKGYKIFKNKTEYVVIASETVAQAIKDSGIENPHKILCTRNSMGFIITAEHLNDMNIEAEIEETPTEETDIVASTEADIVADTGKNNAESEESI